MGRTVSTGGEDSPGDGGGSFLARHALLVVWSILLLALAIGTVSINAIADTLPLQLAADSAGVKKALTGLDLGDVRSALAWDYILPLIYVPLGIIWIRYSRRNFYIIPVAREVGTSLYLIVVVAGLADWIENALLRRLIGGAGQVFTTSGQWEAVWASTFATIKWIGIALVVAYVLPATVWTVWLWASRVLKWQFSVQELPRPKAVDDG